MGALSTVRLAGRPADLMRAAGLSVCGLLALSAWLTTFGVTLTTLVLLIALFYLLVRPEVRRDSMVVVATVWVLFIAARTLHPDPLQQDTVAARWHDAGSWLQLIAFLPVAWFVRGNIRHISIILLLALTGLVLGLLFKSHWSDILNNPIHNRTGFHLTIAYSGFIHSIVILGLIVFAPRLFQSPSLLLRLVWVLLLVLSSYAILVSQSRQTWLMDSILIPLAMGAVYRSGLRSALQPARGTRWPALLAVSLILGLVALNHKLVVRRLHEEQTVVGSILARQQPEQIPKTSFGYRYNVLVFGYRKWLERPWIGWGTGSSKYFIEHSGDPLLIYQEAGKPTTWLRHFHNLYLEILIRYGILGMAFCGAIALILVKTLMRASKAGAIPPDYRVFFLASFAMMAVYSLFGFPLLHPDGRSFVILFAGLAYSFHYRSTSSG